LYVCVCLCVCAILRAPVTSQLLWPCLPRISHYSPGISKTKQNQARWLPWERTCVTEKGLRDRNSPTCTLSQNGYGDEAVWLLQLQRCSRGKEKERERERESSTLYVCAR